MPSKRFRPLIWAAVAALALPWSARAEEGEGAEREEGPPMLQEKYLEQLDRQLQLKDDQKKKIESVLKDSGPKLKKDWEELRKQREEMKKRAEEAQKRMREMQESIRAVLDDEQRERFDEMRMRQKHRMERGGGRRGKGRGGPRGVEMDPEDIPPEIREKMKRGDMWGPGEMPERFPPERWEEGEGMPNRRGMPPEIKEHIERRTRERRRQEPGNQRDLPPTEEWNDQRRVPGDD